MSTLRNISTDVFDTDLLFFWLQNHKQKLCVWWDCNEMERFTSPLSSSCQDLTVSQSLSFILRTQLIGTPSVFMSCLYTLVFPELLFFSDLLPSICLAENLYRTNPMESSETEVCLCRISVCQIRFDWAGFSFYASTARDIKQRTHFCVTHMKTSALLFHSMTFFCILFNDPFSTVKKELYRHMFVAPLLIITGFGLDDFIY
jgi:hypothetical protein